MTKKRLLAALVIVGIVLAAGYLLSSRQKLSSTASLQEALSDAIETVQTQSQKVGISPSGFSLEISSPENGATVSTAVLEVAGKTVPGAEVFVNETLVKLDKNGNFRQRVTLQEGENFILITAGNETGDAEVERTVYFELP
jgi:hypothetical protein